MLSNVRNTLFINTRRGSSHHGCGRSGIANATAVIEPVFRIVSHICSRMQYVCSPVPLQVIGLSLLKLCSNTLRGYC